MLLSWFGKLEVLLDVWFAFQPNLAMGFTVDNAVKLLMPKMQ